MKTSNFAAWTAVAALMAGCAGSPRNGSNEAEYVVVTPRRAATVASPAIAPVQTPAAGRGPADVAHIVYFGFDQWRIEPQYADVVQKHAAYLRANPRRSVVLEGHTDERGGAEYNIGLGNRRAEAVRSALSLLGVSDRQMESVSFGKEKPASLEHTEEGYRLNRRVEFNYR